MECLHRKILTIICDLSTRPGDSSVDRLLISWSICPRYLVAHSVNSVKSTVSRINQIEKVIHQNCGRRKFAQSIRNRGKGKNEFLADMDAH